MLSEYFAPRRCIYLFSLVYYVAQHMCYSVFWVWSPNVWAPCLRNELFILNLERIEEAILCCSANWQPSSLEAFNFSPGYFKSSFPKYHFGPNIKNYFSIESIEIIFSHLCCNVALGDIDSTCISLLGATLSHTKLSSISHSKYS